VNPAPAHRLSSRSNRFLRLFAALGLVSQVAFVGSPVLLVGPVAAGDFEKVPKHSIFADDGAKLKADAPIHFALVGNTRPMVPAVDTAAAVRATPKVPGQIVQDILGQMATPTGPQLLIHLGDGVASSSAADWKKFDKLWSPVLASSTPAPEGKPRLKALPVAGDREAASDEKYEGLGASWPEIGADIGFGRVATWYSFDLNSKGFTWRFIVLDPAKERLGSRWTEQRGWIERTLDRKTGGTYDAVVVLLHDPVLDLGGRDAEMNKGGGPGELVELVEASIGISRLRAVIFAGHNTHQVMLPDGPLGVLHLGAGGGGAPAEALKRWVPADQGGRNQDVPLETQFDLALMDQLDRWNRSNGLPPNVADEAKARDAFEGFIGTYNPAGFPVQGWWAGTVERDRLSLRFRYLRLDGTVEEIYTVAFSEKEGWRPSRPPKAKTPQSEELPPLDG
jgi:hypothetical protein